jgi:hypothetical protein
LTPIIVQREINAIENVFNDSSYPEYDGHFADSIAVTITTVPEPSSYILAIGGFVAILIPRSRGYFCRRG